MLLESRVRVARKPRAFLTALAVGQEGLKPLLPLQLHGSPLKPLLQIWEQGEEQKGLKLEEEEGAPLILIPSFTTICSWQVFNLNPFKA
jgi:hypothetical protein